MNETKRTEFIISAMLVVVIILIVALLYSLVSAVFFRTDQIPNGKCDLVYTSVASKGLNVFVCNDVGLSK